MNDDDQVRVRLLVTYHGAGFRGFAINDPVPTVARALTDAIETVVGHPVSLTCAGRTDAGVHAWGQVVTFDADPARVDPDRMRKSLTKLCRPHIVVRDVTVVERDFDARYSAKWRSYRYRILHRRDPDPFLVDQAWHVARPLDLDAMARASAAVVGSHDFSSFCRRQHVLTAAGDEVEAPRTRRVMYARWGREPDDADTVRFEIAATSFCHQMVRSLVGTLVEVGAGDRPVDDIEAILAARDRNRAGRVAPPHGLYLWEVGY